MGKRKERRLAAKMAAGRRVKLDLFAEPSGDLVGTSAHDGRDTDKDHRAVVPTSSSSSGEKHENPLLLLGQYSDDELEEETSKRPKLDADGSSPDAEDDEEPAENLQGTEKDIDDNGDEGQSDQVHAVESLASTEEKENGSTDAAADYPETDPAAQVTAPEPSGTESNGDLHGGWKLVMHEESNQYYYWNTATGETLWEVPADLAGQTASGVEGGISCPDAHLNIEPATYAYLSAADGMGNNHLISKDAVEHSSVLEIKNENGEIAHVGYDANRAFAHFSVSATGISYADSAALSQFGSSMQTNAVSMGQLTVPIAEGHISNDDDKDTHLGKSDECYGTADAHSSRLVKRCESLLLRLEALDRSGSCLENHECIRKEIDIRLSDCNALSSYGSSLLPFWWHTEARLKQLESAVGEGEASLVVLANHDDNLEATQNYSLREESSPKSMDPESNLMENETGISSTMKHSCSSPSPDVLKLKMEATSQICNSEHAKIEFSSASHLSNEQEPESVQEANPNTTSVHLLLEGEHVHEDVDMDVEMEVDEEPLSVQTTATGLGATDCTSQPEQSVQSNQSIPEFSPLPPDEPSVPPPPDEEWIPPPPPDSEPVPPPPPEEPPLPLVPPLCPDLIPCAPYPDQYNIGYTATATAYQYYSTAADVTGGNYYVQADGTYITQPQPQPYYEPVVTNAVESPAEPVVYYDVAGVAVPSGPAVSSMGSSGYYIESGPFSYHGGVSMSDHTGLSMETASDISLLPKVNPVLEAPASFLESQESTLQTAFVPSGGQSVGNASGNGSTVDALPVASSKNQTKVVRRKKHTVAVAPSLRSNKKVSSLVDKWKAAKEELHSEEDEEPEDPYEILEKKRQKEIEKWRARQIASGEAQDNANFLPLGGDWRDRVKRKKAEAKTESVQTHTEVSEEENKPDLVELSKDLPSGWQAYWDKSSKTVYYGNSITSETTWTRPT